MFSWHSDWRESHNCSERIEFMIASLMSISRYSLHTAQVDGMQVMGI